jgi:hypothetical protein
MSKESEMYTILRGFVERGLCGDNKREVSFKTMDAFEDAVKEDVMQNVAKDIDKARAEGIKIGEERMRLKFAAKALGNKNDKYVSIPAVLLAPVPKTKEEYEKMCRDVGLVPEQPEKDDETR